MSAETIASRRPFRADGQAVFPLARRDPVPAFSPTVSPFDEIATIMDTPYATNHSSDNERRFLNAAVALTSEQELDPQLSERVLRFILARDTQFISLLTEQITGETFLEQQDYRIGRKKHPGSQRFDDLAKSFAQRAGVDIDVIKREIAVATTVDNAAYNLSISAEVIRGHIGDREPGVAHSEAAKSLRELVGILHMPNREYVPDDTKVHLFDTLDKLRHMSAHISSVKEVLDEHGFEDLAKRAERVFDRPGFEYRELLRTRAELIKTNPQATEEIEIIDAKLKELRQKLDRS